MFDNETANKWLQVANLVEHDGRPFSYCLSECIIQRIYEVFGDTQADGSVPSDVRQDLCILWPEWMIHEPSRCRAAAVIRQLVDTGIVEWGNRGEPLDARYYVDDKARQSHDWIPSTLGHGETMCRKCLITNREAAVLGLLNACEA